MDILGDLVKSIQEKQQHPPPTPQQVRAQPLRAVNPLVKSGPGGVLFNFGANAHGNPMVARYNNLLHHHADGEQLAIAKAQEQEINQAFNQYVDQGQHAYELQKGEEALGPNPGVHGGWDEQLSQSTDQQMITAFKKGILSGDPNQSGPAAPDVPLNKDGTPGSVGPRGDFRKSSIQLGGNKIQATSETDAALIEMIQGGGGVFE